MSDFLQSRCCSAKRSSAPHKIGMSSTMSSNTTFRSNSSCCKDFVRVLPFRCQGIRLRVLHRALGITQTSFNTASLSASLWFMAAAPSLAEEVVKVDFGQGGNADPKSYYTVLALFLISVPGTPRPVVEPWTHTVSSMHCVSRERGQVRA